MLGPTSSAGVAHGGKDQRSLLGFCAPSRPPARGIEALQQPAELPISPRRAQAFVHSCRSLRLDQSSIEIVQELFSRFVLDSLGTVYGACNLYLQEEGYLTSDELEFASTAS
jgi:hypothetical protein